VYRDWSFWGVQKMPDFPHFLASSRFFLLGGRGASELRNSILYRLLQAITAFYRLLQPLGGGGHQSKISNQKSKMPMISHVVSHQLTSTRLSADQCSYESSNFRSEFGVRTASRSSAWLMKSKRKLLGFNFDWMSCINAPILRFGA
jgi:hypothetical protein